MKPRKATFSEIKPHLTTGMPWLCEGKSPFAPMIKAKTRNKITHVSTTWMMPDLDKYMVSEAVISGFRLTHISSLIMRPGRHYVWLVEGITVDQQRSILSDTLDLMGTGFDFPGFGKCLYSHTEIQMDLVYCSETLEWLWQQAKIVEPVVGGACPWPCDVVPWGISRGLKGELVEVVRAGTKRER